MPPRPRAPCQICKTTESKYSCPSCALLYCSVACYKKHKESSCEPGASPSRVVVKAPPQEKAGASSSATGDEEFEDKTPLRPLTSLNWPYVPDESAYPDPLKRDDPKPLQLRQYEAIATSPAIREVLGSHPRLKDIMRAVDSFRGPQREDALQRALGVSSADARPDAEHAAPVGDLDYTDEDKQALRKLAEAVEAAVRGGQQDALGLDWGD